MIRRETPSPGSRDRIGRLLLCCGVAAALLYAVVTALVPSLSPGYSSASQTISELSAIGAPTRNLWLVLTAPYTVFTVLFAWGVMRSARGNRRLYVAGLLLLVYGGCGLIWPFAPMHLRETIAAGGATGTDTLHIVMGAIVVLLMLGAIGLGGAGLGRRFQVFSALTVAVVLGAGALTGLEAPGISANTPTPWIGVWERISLGAFLLWTIALAGLLLRRSGQPPR